MKKCLFTVVALSVLVGCIEWPPNPQPTPTPEPTATPTPLPTPTPDPTPEPTPTPTPPPTCECDLEGRAQARISWYQQGNRWIADGTPAVCASDRCDAFGCFTPGRYCCPVNCDGDPCREECETLLMGGPAPEWELEVSSGNLRLVEHEWFGIVAGKGKGRIRWSYPNGKATSKWLPIDKQ